MQMTVLAVFLRFSQVELTSGAALLQGDFVPGHHHRPGTPEGHVL